MIHSHACWITVFGPSRLEDEDRQEDLGINSLVCLDPFVKLRIVDKLKCTTHTSFMFWDLVFMNSLIKTSLHGLYAVSYTHLTLPTIYSV